MMARVERIGSYAVIGELGRGASSRVLLAQRDGEPDVRVLKQLRLELANDPMARKRFSREASLAARLDHPNIAKICWSGIEDGSFYIAMELVAGQTLGAIAAQLAATGRRMPEEIAIAIALQILSGLEYAHELTDAAGQPLSIVHRDLSPANVMVGYSGLVKIIDFGTARAQLGDFRTSPGVRIGTLRYMSPEQSMSQPVDRRSDLYTLSVVLWELSTGRRLVQATSTVDVLEEVAYGAAPPANEIVPEISSDFAEVIARGLAKEPRHRWQSARELADALRQDSGETALLPVEIGRFVRELFPDAEQTAARAVELARQRHFQDHEETMPDDTQERPAASRDNQQAEATVYIDTITPEPSAELPAHREELPQRGSKRFAIALFLALMLGFAMGVATERAGWWRRPPPGGAGLQGANPQRP
jgi:serine/threonine-protein kinase